MLRRNPVVHSVCIFSFRPKWTVWRQSLLRASAEVLIGFVFVLWDIQPVVLINMVTLRKAPVTLHCQWCGVFIQPSCCGAPGGKAPLRCSGAPSGHSGHSLAERPVQTGWLLLAQQLRSPPLTACLSRFRSSFTLLPKSTAWIWVQHLRKTCQG